MHSQDDVTVQYVNANALTAREATKTLLSELRQRAKSDSVREKLANLINKVVAVSAPRHHIHIDIWRAWDYARADEAIDILLEILGEE